MSLEKKTYIGDLKLNRFVILVFKVNTLRYKLKKTGLSYNNALNALNDEDTNMLKIYLMIN